MALTFKEWREAVDKMSSERAQELLEALDTLRGWQDFHDAFDNVGIFGLNSILRARTAGKGIVVADDLDEPGFHLACSAQLHRLEGEVNDMLAEGWEIHGTIFRDEQHFVQALKRPTKEQYRNDLRA